MSEVIIAVHGGVASLISAPNDTVIHIRDYDVEGFDLEGERLTKDNDGDSYIETEL